MAYRSVSNFRISIHALREEGDNSAEAATNRAWQISIHALREEGDNRTSGAASKTTPFLSTPSARRATGCSQGICFGSRFLSTPSARRATARRRFHCGLGQGFLSTPSARRATQGERVSLANSEISIHALREEGDFCPCISATLVLLFLSTPSARRATEAQDYPTATDCISIHALREEGDPTSPSRASMPDYFYPRPPRGGRQERCSTRSPDQKFLSTPSARRATSYSPSLLLWNVISIHALREEGDQIIVKISREQINNFYPRPPRGGRR